MDSSVVEPLGDDQLRAQLVVPRTRVRDRRDEAVRGCVHLRRRAGEIVALQTADLSLRTDPPTASTRHGRGGTDRVVLSSG